MPAALTQGGGTLRGGYPDHAARQEIRYSGISREGQTVQIRFRDAEARDKAAAEIQRQNPDCCSSLTTPAASFWLRLP